MAADPPAPAGPEARPEALSNELEELKGLLQALQSGLGPGVQSALRERSEEVQRLAGELAGRDERLQQLDEELAAARARIADLEREVGRWQEAARTGVEEIAERARAAAEAFRAEVEMLRRDAGALRGELSEANAEIERGRSRLKKAQSAYEAVASNPWWRSTALMREPAKTWTGWMKAGARLRRRLFKG